MEPNLRMLKDKADAVAKNAHAPYSGFSVGAVIVTTEGQQFNGCNVENISSGLTVCAERNAVGKAVSELGPDFKIKEIFVSNFNSEGVTIHCSPCGACRQVLAEFSTSDTKVHYHGDNGNIITTTVKDLLPDGFDNY
ncbi:cytidine deaminase [Sneathiella glossodoripedis]|uniref:cytidine deaminase n=1 Tax=Sneathiella glossodoripedis TaxID=418853 RepID=UPI0004725225|nr:cytidine deaminase [Sneathiella glossodoripedis]